MIGVTSMKITTFLETASKSDPCIFVMLFNIPTNSQQTGCLWKVITKCISKSLTLILLWRHNWSLQCEIKAWKKIFRPEWDLNPWPLQYWFIFLCSSIYVFDLLYIHLYWDCFFFFGREEHERIGDIIKKYGHFLKVHVHDCIHDNQNIVTFLNCFIVYRQGSGKKKKKL